MKEIDGQRSQLPKIQAKLANPAAKDNPGIESACNALLKLAEERRLSAIANEYLRQTGQKFASNFFEPFVGDTGRPRGMTKAEREAANSLMELWKLDAGAPDFGRVDPVVKSKLTALFSQFDAMKAAAAAYDDYWQKMANLRARVTYRSQSPPKWKTANGADIYNASDYSTTVKYGDKVNISLKDSANAPFEGSVTIDTGEEGEQTVRSGGATLRFDVKHTGQKPPNPTSLARLRQNPPSATNCADPMPDWLTDLGSKLGSLYREAARQRARRRIRQTSRVERSPRRHRPRHRAAHRREAIPLRAGPRRCDRCRTVGGAAA